MKTAEPINTPSIDLHTTQILPSDHVPHDHFQTTQLAAPILFTEDEHDAHSEHDHDHPEIVPLPLGHRIANLVVIMMPIVATIAGATYAWGWGFGWLELGLFLGMYLLTGLGITIGFHRLFTHKSFETNRPMTAFLAIAGSMAIEGPLLDWVAFHRCHHQHSDHHDDPHTPHGHGSGIKGILKGIWRAQMGWLFEPKRPDIRRYVPDLEKDRMISTISKLTPLWVFLSFALPSLIGGLVTMSWVGAILGFVWGGLVRVVFVHHVTWSVNSICHVWGTQPFKSHDESRNNPIVGILAFGEGWHNNHHAFPTSARHGLKWWQVDVSWLLIWAASKVGLAQKVRVPTRERMESKRR